MPTPTNSRTTLALVSGSLRAGSTNTALLRTVPELVDASVDTVLYEDMAALPHFNPDDDYEPLHPAVQRLRTMIAEADAVVFCTPEYAGALPGSFKNLLDWTVGGDEIGDKPVAWVNASSSPTGAAGAHHSLRAVLGYTGARIVDEACVHLPVLRSEIATETLTLTDPATRQALAAVTATLVTRARETGDEAGAAPDVG